MFNSSFKYVCVGYTKSANDTYILGIRHYCFHSPKYRYLVEVECYINSIYVIQYYPTIHKGNPRKYMLLTKEHQCKTIVGTCISIMNEILINDPLATFAFIGSNTYNPDTGLEEPINQTKRFKVYKHAMEGKMGTITFTHAWSRELSQYVMVNKRQDQEFILDEINRIFNGMYDKDKPNR